MARKEVGFVVTDDYKTWIEEVKNKIRNSICNFIHTTNMG